MSITSATLHENMDASIYHADPCAEPSLSSSLARILVTQSPAHARARHPRLTRTPIEIGSTAMDIGTVVHAMLLQGENVTHVVNADDWRTAAAKTERDEARAAGKIPVLIKDYDRCRDITSSVRHQIDLIDADPPLLTNGKPEQTILWHEDGVHFRCRLDWFNRDGLAIDDLKTHGRSAEPTTWAKNQLYAEGGYLIQAALYRRGVRALLGRDPQFRYIVVESNPPYGVSVVTLDDAGWDLAESQLDYAIRLWKQCVETNQWPGYPATVIAAEPPYWAESKWYERNEEAVA